MNDDDDVESARCELRALALELHGQAADKHFEGMELCRRASRIEQLAEIANSAEVLEIRERFVEEGLLVVLSINGPGGDC